MSTRSKNILALANGPKNNTPPITITPNEVDTKNKYQDKENYNQQLISKNKIDDKGIWSYYLTLEDMKEIKNGNFEYSNSYEYIKLINLSQLTQALLNKQLIQPLPEIAITPNPLPLTLEYPVGPRPASPQLAWTQTASTLPAPSQIALAQILTIQPAFIEMALSPPNLAQLVPVQLSQGDQTSAL